MVSNDVFDLLAKHDKATLPAALTDYVERMQREQYDYSEHSRVGADHGAQVSDERASASASSGRPSSTSRSCGASRPRASTSGTSTSYLARSRRSRPTARRLSRAEGSPGVVRRRRLPLTLLALLAACALFAQAGSTSRGQESGFFRGSASLYGGFDHVDPALAFTQPAWALLDTVCARLMTHPDKSTPKAFELVPEVATAQPKVSSDFKTFTFTLRKGFRFSDGTPVRANAFAHAINRTLAPGVNSPGALFTRDIVGAADVLAGRAKTAKGVAARGHTLVVRLTRPTPDFAARTSLPFFCAVPPGLPPNAEGARAFDAAGPFYVSEYRPGERVEIRPVPPTMGVAGRAEWTASTSTCVPHRPRT